MALNSVLKKNTLQGKKLMKIKDDFQEQVEKILQKIDGVLTIHDFRIVPGTTHTKIIFDLVIPFGYKKSQEEIVEQIQQDVKKVSEQYYVVITVDRK